MNELAVQFHNELYFFDISNLFHKHRGGVLNGKDGKEGFNLSFKSLVIYVLTYFNHKAVCS